MAETDKIAPNSFKNLGNASRFFLLPLDGLPQIHSTSSVANREYHLAGLGHLREEICCKRQDLWVENSCIFQPDKAPSYACMTAIDFLVKHETSVIAQPPPDLAPSDFFCFRS